MATYIGTDANNNITYQVEPSETQTMLPNTGVAKFQDEIAQILETVTTYKGQPVVVTSAEDMTEENVIYLYMGEEEGYNADHWYYYDTENETWTDGGAYVANPVIIDDTLTQAGEAADAKATGDKITQLKSDFDELVKAVIPYEVYESKYLAPSGTTVTITNMSGYFINLYKVENDGWFNISGVFSGAVDAVVIFTNDSLETYSEVIYISTVGAGVAKNYTMFIRQGSVIGLCSSNEHKSKMAVNSIGSTIISTKDLYQTVIKTDLAIPAYFGYKGYVSNNGTITKITSFDGKYKYFIYPIEEGDICEVSTHIQGGVSYACFVNSSLQQIGEKLICTQNVQVEAYSGVITAPQNAKYLITTEYDGNKTQTIVKSRITKLEEKTEQISENSAMASITPTVQIGKYIDRDGAVQSMSTYNVYGYVADHENYIRVHGVTKGHITIVSVWRDNAIVNKVLVSNDNTNNTPFDELLYLTDGDEVRVTQLVSLGIPTFEEMNESLSCAILESRGQQEIYGKTAAPIISNASKTDVFDLSGKIINVVGDSMTSQGYISEYIAQKYSCTARNYGVPGSAITYEPNETVASFATRIIDTGHVYNYQDADVWVIWGGYNDYNSEIEIGGINDTSIETLYGALKAIVSTLQSKLNMPSIVFVTPCRVNRESKKMHEIVMAMTVIASNYGVPILNLYNTSGVSANNYRTLTEDGLHLNELGRNMVYSKIAKFVKDNV